MFLKRILVTSKGERISLAISRKSPTSKMRLTIICERNQENSLDSILGCAFSGSVTHLIEAFKHAKISWFLNAIGAQNSLLDIKNDDKTWPEFS